MTGAGVGQSSQWIHRMREAIVITAAETTAITIQGLFLASSTTRPIHPRMTNIWRTLMVVTLRVGSHQVDAWG